MDINANRINVNEPRYDQNTYAGRAKHFFITTDPRNLLASSVQLENAKQTVTDYRNGKNLPGVTEDELWKAKHLYDSAFHPDTGEKMFLIGRMSAQVPMNMTITGCMLTFYKTTPTVIFWQWMNQTFNATVNYTNRSGHSDVSVKFHGGASKYFDVPDLKTLFKDVDPSQIFAFLKEIGISYALATSGAMGTALGLKTIAHKFPPLLARYVPFAAVAAANCINIPCMRSGEITDGIAVFTKDGEKVGESKKAAKSAITQVVFSRIAMAAPTMMIPPIIMQRLERGAFLQKYKFMNAPIQVLLVGCLLTFSTPLCCALFPQKSSMAVSSLEPEIQQKVKEMGGDIDRLYFNKGL